MKQKANLSRRPKKGCTNQDLWTLTIRKMGLVYTVYQTLIVLSNGYREVILAVRTRFSSSCCCGKVAVVERLKRKCMTCPPGPNQVAVVERWPIVEVRLYAMHIIKCKTLNDFLLFPPLPLHICPNLISTVFVSLMCSTILREVQLTYTSLPVYNLYFGSVLLIWKNRLWKFSLLVLWMVVDGVITKWLETKEIKDSKVNNEYTNQSTKANQQQFPQHQDKMVFLLSPVPFDMLWSFSSYNCLTEEIFWFSLTSEGRGLPLRKM